MLYTLVYAPAVSEIYPVFWYLDYKQSLKSRRASKKERRFLFYSPLAIIRKNNIFVNKLAASGGVVAI